MTSSSVISTLQNQGVKKLQLSRLDELESAYSEVLSNRSMLKEHLEKVAQETNEHNRNANIGEEDITRCSKVAGGF